MVRTNIWYRVKEKGFSIPFPTRTVEHIQLDQKQQAQTASATEQRYLALKDLWLFAPLSEEEKRKLAASAGDLYLAHGQVLFRQGDAGDSLYVIRNGEVDVLVKQAGGAEAKVATLGPGNFFGEMAALTGEPRSATIRATGELSCVRISKADLSAIFAADPSIMTKISQLHAERYAQLKARQQAAPDAGAHAEAVKTEQTTFLGRMARFFGMKSQDASH
jgi:CRP-like cAMP-binding protein